MVNQKYLADLIIRTGALLEDPAANGGLFFDQLPMQVNLRREIEIST